MAVAGNKRGSRLGTVAGGDGRWKGNGGWADGNCGWKAVVVQAAVALQIGSGRVL